MGDELRLAGENIEYVRILAESDEPLPPILVQRDGMPVIYRMQRLRVGTESGPPLLWWLAAWAAGLNGHQGVLDAASSDCLYAVAELTDHCATELA